MYQSKLSILQIRDHLLTTIVELISPWFESFEDNIFRVVIDVDHHPWDFDYASYGVLEIQKLAEHFSLPLQSHKDNTQVAVCRFRQLKKLVRAKYLHMQIATIV